MKEDMKNLKESFFGNLGIGKEGKRQLIEDWLKKYNNNIKKYTINSDLTINAKSVKFFGYSESNFPDFIKFNEVETFEITHSKITSLRGCPNECVEFNCCFCKNLTSLEGCPKQCKIFSCYNCPNLKSLEGAPKNCNSFDCTDCFFTEEDIKKVCNAKYRYW